MARVRDSLRRPGTPPLCSVCDGRRQQEPIILCVDCAHPDRVRTYCALCKIRLDLALEDAQELFRKFGLTIPHSGITLLFHSGCPDCRAEECVAPEVYALDDPELNYGHVA